jgi:hypothetical protein
MVTFSPQGLLGGFALLSFFTTYVMYTGSTEHEWLKCEA